MHRTYANSDDRASGVDPCLDLKAAAAMTTKEIGSATGVPAYSPSAEPWGERRCPSSAPKPRFVLLREGLQAANRAQLSCLFQNEARLGL